MARRRKRKTETKVTDYRHDAKRKNLPPAGLAAHGKVEELREGRYAYDPHLAPVLRFDETGEPDRLLELLQEAQQRRLTEDEATLLAEALRNHQPWIEWAGKREQRWFDVDPIALHIHERVSAQAIIGAAKREPMQRSFFADPELEYREAVQFYQHDVDWANRLILGDSLVVMHSLARREDLAGKVQMIYVDPPYGIKFSSNFQPLVKDRSVKDRGQDLTREPEQVKAYRDTWRLGVHSYLGYLRDRIIVARELLTDSGSIFVQISDENLHRVRMVLDEVFGAENFCALVAFAKTSAFTSTLLSSSYDFLLWYAKSIEQVKYNPLLRPKVERTRGGTYTWIDKPNGEARRMTSDERRQDPKTLVGVPFRADTIVSPGATSTGSGPLQFEGKEYLPSPGSHWKASVSGMSRLIKANRVVSQGKRLAYKRLIVDYPMMPFANMWDDTILGTFSEKWYVVQTSATAIERCMLMTSDPGDLVLDPTCGGGTTAYVAEQWGRRWITIDNRHFESSHCFGSTTFADCDI
jgi:adenine-specific DNA-methyltransferase